MFLCFPSCQIREDSQISEDKDRQKYELKFYRTEHTGEKQTQEKQKLHDITYMQDPKNTTNQ